MSQPLTFCNHTYLLQTDREPVNMKTFCSLVSSVRQAFNESRQKQEKLVRDVSLLISVGCGNDQRIKAFSS